LIFNGSNYSSITQPTTSNNVFVTAGTGSCQAANQPTITTINGICNNLHVTSTGIVTIATGQKLTVNGNLTNNGTITSGTGTGSIDIKGNWTNNSTFTPGTGTVTFNGTNIQTIGGTANTTFYNFTTNRATTVNELIFGDATNSNKVYTVTNAFTWTDNDDKVLIGQAGASGQRLIVPTINIPSGCTLQFEANSSNYLDINNGGGTVSFLLNGTFVPGIGTVRFNGTAAQFLRSSYNISFYNLIIDRNATSNAFTIGNASTTNIIFAITNNFSWIDHNDKIILGLTATGQTLSVPSITIP